MPHRLAGREAFACTTTEPRIPALPGEENVTDGSVDDYGTDWENVDNGALEEEMAKCAANPL